MTVHSARRRARGRKTGFAVCFFFVATVCIVTNCKRVILCDQIAKATKQNEAVTREYQNEQERTDELKRLKVDCKTRQFIESTAREKFGLVYKNEIVFEPDTKTDSDAGK